MPTGSQEARSEAGAAARVLVIDPHPACRKALAAEIATAGGRLSQMGQAASVDEALTLMRGDRPDAIVLEVDASNVTEHITRLLERAPGIPILVISADASGDLVLDAITAGSRGFVPWAVGIGEVIRAVRSVATGKVAVDPSVETEALLAAARRLSDARQPDPRLTQRERETLDLLATGMSAKDIAASLATSRRTVETHLANAYRKLRVSSRSEALRAYAQMQVSAPPSERLLEHREQLSGRERLDQVAAAP